MLTLSRRTIIAGTALGTIALAVPMAIAANEDSNGGMPANKAVAAGSKRVVFGPGPGKELLTATFKTSKPTDLLMSVSLECSLFTQIVTSSTEAGASSTSTAAARIRAWLEIDGKIVPIMSTSTPPQDGATPEAGDESDKVTFCDRTYSRTVTDAEDDGQDTEDDYIRTKAANAFNWVRLNAGSGLHTVRLLADIREGVVGQGSAEAEIGNRTLIIEPTKMANNAVIGPEGSS